MAMEDYSSRDAAQRRDGTSRVSAGTTSKPCEKEGNTDSLTRLYSYPPASCRKTL